MRTADEPTNGLANGHQDEPTRHKKGVIFDPFSCGSGCPSRWCYSLLIAIVSSFSRISSRLYSDFSPLEKINLSSYSNAFLVSCLSCSVMSMFTSLSLPGYALPYYQVLSLTVIIILYVRYIVNYYMCVILGFFPTHPI